VTARSRVDRAVRVVSRAARAAGRVAAVSSLVVLQDARIRIASRVAGRVVAAARTAKS